MNITLEQYKAMNKPKKSKYKNVKIVVDGITFDSKKEADRYSQLRFLENNGIIFGLQRQVQFVLIPMQKVNGKLQEKSCAYFADFVYMENGKTIVEDAKGYKTNEYKIKKKLMLFIHGIIISEV